MHFKLASKLGLVLVSKPQGQQGYGHTLMRPNTRNIFSSTKEPNKLLKKP